MCDLGTRPYQKQAASRTDFFLSQWLHNLSVMGFFFPLHICSNLISAFSTCLSFLLCHNFSWVVASPLGPLTSSFSFQSPPHGIVSARAFPSSPLGSIPSAHGQDQVSWTLKNRPWLLPTAACSDHPSCLFSLPQRSHRE